MTASHTASPQDIAFAKGFRDQYRAAIPEAGEPDPVASVQQVNIPATHPDRQIPVRIYTPKTLAAGETLPVILFFHGGGFISGDLDTHDVLARALALRTPAIVMAVDYRLAPEHPFPAGLNDGIAVLDWAAKNAGTYGADPKQIALAGDSAGGNLASALAIYNRDHSAIPVKSQVLLYPSLAGNTSAPSWQTYGTTHFPQLALMETLYRYYLPQDTGARPLDALAAPLEDSLKNLPPAFVATAEKDPLKDEGRLFAEKMQQAGGEAVHAEYPDVEHGFVQFFKSPPNRAGGEQALDQATDFLREHFKAH